VTPTRWAAIATGCAALAVVVVAARGGPAPAARRVVTVSADGGIEADAGYSNVAARDYVGPRACGECHEKNYARWQSSLHAAMNRRTDVSDGAVIGDFGGAHLDYAGGRVSFEREGAAYVMALAPPGAPARRFRVTRTIGSRYLQEYVGVQLVGPEAPGDPIYTTEIRLPFGWWQRTRTWLHQQYFDSWYGAEYAADGRPSVDAYAPDRTPWASRCAWCHNTYPFELRALRTLHDPPLGEGPEQYFDYTPAPGVAAARASVIEHNLLPVDELVTVGVSCESCHGGGREHAVEGRPIHFAPTSPALHARADAPSLEGGRQNHVLVITICAQCHSTPTPRWPDGAAQRNSSEALDLDSGACLSQVKCTDCHDPHQAGPGSMAPDQPRQLAACVRCHGFLATPRAQVEHAGHRAGSASCLDCHMPRVVQGVSDYVRSHRISSPADPRMLSNDTPNACNLCHLDRSVKWTVAALASHWGKQVTVAAPLDDRPAGEAWLHSPSPALRAVAAAAFARLPAARARAALPALLAVLDDPIAYYRMRLLFAIEDILGRRLPPAQYDPTAPPATRAAQRRALLAHPPRPGAAVGTGPAPSTR
jgi:predicted CXXCH cytochrome family protein